MKRHFGMRPALAALLSGLTLCLPLLAHTGGNVEETCPYDGTKFQYYAQASGSSFDNGLDLMPLGAIISPHPIASCPTNGFVFLKARYSNEELERLRPFIFSAEFQALKEDTPYYRAAWLTERTGGTHARASELLLQASWEAQNRPTLYKRYAGELVKRLPEDIASAEAESKFTYQLLYAELLRRLSRFEESVDFLTQLAAQAQLPEQALALVAYEKALAMRRDDAPHRMSEAHPSQN
jgi:hypothetical protein